MTAPAPKPLRGRSRAARLDRAYRALLKAIRAERRALAALEKARARYIETVVRDLSKEITVED